MCATTNTSELKRKMPRDPQEAHDNWVECLHGGNLKAWSLLSCASPHIRVDSAKESLRL